MKGFLIDTNILSEYNRSPRVNSGVKQWLEGTRRELQYVSVITLAEIQKGIELLAYGQRRRDLEQWLTRNLIEWFSDRILPVDYKVASRWASLMATSSRSGSSLPSIDLLIAATALEHGLEIVTRNERHFVGIGLTIVNPWT